MAILSDGSPYTKAIPLVGGGYSISYAPKTSSKSSAITHTTLNVPKTSNYYKAPAPAPKPVQSAPAPTYSGGGGGGGGGGYATVAAPVADPTQDPAYLASVAKLNDLWNTANGYKGQIDGLVNGGFNYDPNTDPSYAALKQSAATQSKVAQKQAMDTMNDRGILNSTVTSDRVAQIGQTAQDAVTAQIPTLSNAAYAKYMDKVQSLVGLWNSTVSQAQNQQAYQENQREFNLNYNLDLSKFNTQTSQWQQQFNYTKSQDVIQNQQAKDNYNLQLMAHEQDALGYKNTQATNNALADLLSLGSQDKALKALQQNSSSYANQGVSITDLLNGLEKRFPGTKSTVSSGANMYTQQ